MSAEWQTQQPQSWKLTLPCTKAEAEAIAAGAPTIEALDTPPTVMTSEPDPAQPDLWQLDAYFEGEPDPETLALVRALAPSAADVNAVPAPVEEQDWVTLSQAFLEPIRAGRFIVHTAAHRAPVPDGAIAFEVEASRAFGTGHHETTHGCLEMLDRLARDGEGFAAIADIGTGTGLLALAAQHLWPEARLLASDIDPISIDVAREVFDANGADPDVTFVVAPGVDDDAIRQQAPFNLLIANILAGPLIELAPGFAGVIAPGATVILAGLLDTQEAAVLEAYQRIGLDIHHRLQHGDWPILALRGRA